MMVSANLSPLRVITAWCAHRVRRVAKTDEQRPISQHCPTRQWSMRHSRRRPSKGRLWRSARRARSSRCALRRLEMMMTDDGVRMRRTHKHASSLRITHSSNCFILPPSIRFVSSCMARSYFTGNFESTPRGTQQSCPQDHAE